MLVTVALAVSPAGAAWFYFLYVLIRLNNDGGSDAADRDSPFSGVTIDMNITASGSGVVVDRPSSGR
jgi:hypothetical protein